MNEAPDGHGTLNWMVSYQNLHGGVVIKYYSTELESVREVVYLEALGRTPVLWRKWA